VKGPAFCFIYSLYDFVLVVVSILLILALIYIITFSLFWNLLVLVFVGVLDVALNH
jgi:hypothetical protein